MIGRNEKRRGSGRDNSDTEHRRVNNEPKSNKQKEKLLRFSRLFRLGVDSGFVYYDE